MTKVALLIDSSILSTFFRLISLQITYTYLEKEISKLFLWLSHRMGLGRHTDCMTVKEVAIAN